MNSLKVAATVALSLAVLGLSASGQPQAGPAVSNELATHRAVLDKYCVTCHNGRMTTPATASGVMLDRADLNRVADDPALWEKVIRKLRTGGMPPEGSSRPDRATEDALAGFIESRLDRAALERPNPGRSSVHRLNRA
ncbi:MAG TPA: cytochrome c, partial [Terriglobia bacterium]|nr:cytochrome c [Terriglobia bacterium]